MKTSSLILIALIAPIVSKEVQECKHVEPIVSKEQQECKPVEMELSRPQVRGDSNISLLFLGDSITFGCGAEAAPKENGKCNKHNGGYRTHFVQSLFNVGYKHITTHGTSISGPDNHPKSWKRHEGHPGCRSDDLDKILEKTPEILEKFQGAIMIHLGTNDCLQGKTPDVIIGDMSNLLKNIFNKAPNATVYLASIIGLPSDCVCANDFNKMLPSLVAKHKTHAMNIHYVPMAETSGLCTTETTFNSRGLCDYNNIHPNEAGYLRMAAVFLLSFLDTFRK